MCQHTFGDHKRLVTMVVLDTIRIPRCPVTDPEIVSERRTGHVWWWAVCSWYSTRYRRFQTPHPLVLNHWPFLSVTCGVPPVTMSFWMMAFGSSPGPDIMAQ